MVNFWVFCAGKHLKPYQGLKLKHYLLRYRSKQCRKTPKTLSGIETLPASESRLIPKAGKHLKPYQGLKHNIAK